MLTTRELPPAEWAKLPPTVELGVAWRLLNPAETVIVVVEDAGQIVACWALMRCWMAEGVWIAPERRVGLAGGRIARALLAEFRRASVARGVRTVVTGCLTESVRRVLVKLKAAALPPMAMFAVQGDKQ